MEPKRRDIIGAGLLAAVLVASIAILYIATWQAAH